MIRNILSLAWGIIEDFIGNLHHSLQDVSEGL